MQFAAAVWADGTERLQWMRRAGRIGEGAVRRTLQLQQQPDLLQLMAAFGVPQAVVADFVKAPGQDVLQVTAYELHSFQPAGPLALRLAETAREAHAVA